MESKNITFDEVFAYWLNTEAKQIEGRDILAVAKYKGFNSIAEWRLATAIRLGLDKKLWKTETLSNPNEMVLNIIIGPYQGWSIFFENKLDTTFADALQIPKFLEWCKAHDRIVPISENFPFPTTFIVARRSNGQLIHIEGGHRMCAIAYRNAIGNPIDFSDTPPITLYVTDFDEKELPLWLEFLKMGTNK